MPDTITVKDLTARLERGINNLFHSEKYAEYLKTMSRFHKYSTRNTMLIHMQKPGATYVAGFRSWPTKFGRSVKKGEKAIKILAPRPFIIKKELEKIDPVTQKPIIDENGDTLREEIEIKAARYVVVNVFDVKQTHGKPLPSLVQDLEGNVEQYEAFMDALREVSPLPIVFEPMPDDTDGECIYGEKIAIRDGMSQIQTVSAVIHEITHAKLHDKESLRLMDEAAVPKDRRTEEVEAESVSYAVCQYFGIETGDNSFGYVMEWSRSLEFKELNASLDTIRKAANEIIEATEGRFQALVKERDINLAMGEMQIEMDEPQADFAESQTNKERTIPPSGTIFARYSNQVSEAVKAEEAYANAVLNDILNVGEETARAECQAAIKRAVTDIYENSSEHLYLYIYHTEDEDFRARLEDYAFIRAYLEPRTERMNAAEQITQEMSPDEVLNDREEMLRRIIDNILQKNPDFPAGSLEGMKNEYQNAPIEGLREAYLFYFPSDAPKIEREAAPVSEAPAETVPANGTPADPTISPESSDLIAVYARNAGFGNTLKVGTGTLMTPVFNENNFNRTGKKIRVTVEEPIGKYQIFSREEYGSKALYFLTASGMIDRLGPFFREKWNEETRKYEAHVPSEAEIDSVLLEAEAQFEKDIAEPGKWAKYQHAAVVNRLDECEAHNVPVRELQKVKDAQREEEAEQAKIEREQKYQEKFDARVDEIAKAIEKGEAIDVRFSESAFHKNPVNELFKLYGIDLPLRTQGWVNERLSELSGSSIGYYRGKRQRKPTTFLKCHYKLQQAIKQTPIEQQRQYSAGKSDVNVMNKAERKSIENRLYDKFSELFPQILSGEYRHMRLESSGFMPLSVEWIGGGRISIMHTYKMNGDTMYDPMVDFTIDRENGRLTAAAFEQSSPQIYQRVEENGDGFSVDGNGNQRKIHGLEGDINDFAEEWFSTIEQQGFMPTRATMLRDGEDVELTFDAQGNSIMPEPEKQEVEVGDILLIKGKKWLVEKIDGDFSINMKNLDPNDNNSGKGFWGRWKQSLEEEGYSIITAQEKSAAKNAGDNLREDKPKKEYDLGYGFLGNGITVYNRAEERNNDYVTVAHIGTDRKVTFYDKALPHEIKQQIDNVANSPDTKGFGFAPAPQNVLPEPSGPNAPSFTVLEAMKKQFLESEISGFDYPLPDPAISLSEMNQFGYAGNEMFPLENERAVELFDADHCVYLLYPNNTENMALDRDEIIKHDGICGIERPDWERSPILAAQLAEAKKTEASREADFLYSDGNKYGIYQVKGGKALRDYRFSSISELENLNLDVQRENYELVYTAPITERIEFLSDRYPVLNNVFTSLNTVHPEGYTGRSPSVSDIIVIKCNGDVYSHYVDSTGFVEIDYFLGEEKAQFPEKRETPSNSQVGNKQNEYSGPTVAELDADVKAGKAISLTDLAKAVHAERKDEQNSKPPNPRRSISAKGKPTLMERLEEGKRKAAQHGQPDAQKTNHKEARA